MPLTDRTCEGQSLRCCWEWRLCDKIIHVCKIMWRSSSIVCLFITAKFNASINIYIAFSQPFAASSVSVCMCYLSSERSEFVIGIFTLKFWLGNLLTLVRTYRDLQVFKSNIPIQDVVVETGLSVKMWAQQSLIFSPIGFVLCIYDLILARNRLKSKLGLHGPGPQPLSSWGIQWWKMLWPVIVPQINLLLLIQTLTLLLQWQWKYFSHRWCFSYKKQNNKNNNRKVASVK